MKKRIAVCGNGWDNEYLKIVLSGIQTCAAQNNTDIFTFINFSVPTTDVYMQNGHQNIDRLLEFGKFDGVILLANTIHLQSEFDYLCNLMKERAIPCVSLEYHLPDIDFLGSDNYSGMHELCTHMVAHHHCKEFVYISGPKDNHESNIRRQAVEDVLKEHSLRLENDHIIYGNWNYYDVTQALPAWLETHKTLPDVFVCANDVMAMAACSILQELGYSVPDDVKVTGFDHLSPGQNYAPTIATVDRSWDIMGHQSLQYLLDKINGQPSKAENYIHSHAVFAESCGCLPDTDFSKKRRLQLTSSYENNIANSFWSEHLCELTDYLSKAKSEKDLHRSFTNFAKKDHHYEGNEFYICLMDNFFSSLKTDTPLSFTGYTDKMRLIYGLKNEKNMKMTTFPTSELIPDYDYENDCGRMYAFLPLYSTEGSYGYAVFGEQIPMLYDYSAHNWIRSISQNLNHVRQNIVITELNNKLERLSVTDGLTGVYNRFGCEEIAYPYLKHRHTLGKDAVLLFADINKMKEINDQFGHLHGDTAIRTVAKVIKETLSDDWIVVRYGGDEFLMVGEYSENTAPEEITDRINKHLEQTTNKMELPYPLTIGIGHVIIYADEALNLSECLKKADDAMYQMKKRQRKQSSV